MQKTLNEMLRDLQCFKYDSLDLCRTIGNGLGDTQWRITYINTAGGEQFRFAQVDFVGREGSGIYHQSVADAENYAQERVRELFSKSDKSDANEFDWHPRGRLADL